MKHLPKPLLASFYYDYNTLKQELLSKLTLQFQELCYAPDPSTMLCHFSVVVIGLKIVDNYSSIIRTYADR